MEQNVGFCMLNLAVRLPTGLRRLQCASTTIKFWVWFVTPHLPQFCTFAKIQQTTITFVISICLSSLCPTFYPDENESFLLLEGFSWELIFGTYIKISRENWSLVNRYIVSGTAYEDLHMLKTTPCWNVSGSEGSYIW